MGPTSVKAREATACLAVTELQFYRNIFDRHRVLCITFVSECTGFTMLDKYREGDKSSHQVEYFPIGSTFAS